MINKTNDAPVEGKIYALTGGTGDKAISNGNSWAESLVEDGHTIGSNLATREPIKDRIAKYMALVSELDDEYNRVNHFTHRQGKVTIEASYGRSYAKIIINDTGRCIHTFINLKNGDILKGTWKAPVANGVRGNIYAADLGRSVITNHGAKYLR